MSLGVVECPTLAFVVPCFNEHEGLEICMKKLLSYMQGLEESSKIAQDSFIVMVDDGSIDGTFDVIEKLHNENRKFKGVKFTKNYGSQNAILAGLEKSYELGADCTISIDADLQQELGAVDKFLDEYRNGNDIVFGVRSKYLKKMFVKSYFSKLFYKIISALGAKIVPNHSEFRLVSAKALKILSNYREHNIFLRGLFVDFGLKSTTVEYDIIDRVFGKTKFNYAKLTQLALNGITSFSIVPLRLVAIMGVTISFMSFAIGIYALVARYIIKSYLPNWTPEIVAIAFLAGIQIFCIGVIGEYLGMIYNEVKARPRYILDRELV